MAITPEIISLVILLYFGLLFLISYFTSRNADNQSFFLGNKKSPWVLVAFGMIGTSLSGVTFISVPGWVASSQFSYMQMVLGYLFGYVVIAQLLMPLYYRLNLTSIYGYLEQRYGRYAYKTGASFFILSRLVGASFRLFLVANVLQLAIFDAWGIPFYTTVGITIALIWIYTFKGGIKTIVWTDTLQTLFMLLAVGITIVQVGDTLQQGMSELWVSATEAGYTKIFFFEDWQDEKFFFKQFFAGMFIAIVMTGLDQDMMQKNLSCENIRKAQYNMYSFSIVLVVVNFFFLLLGALLYLYADKVGFSLPAKGDDLYPLLALDGGLGNLVPLLFILGLIAAAYSSADSALTALTTSFCIDILDYRQEGKQIPSQSRKIVHLGMSFMLFILISLFSLINNEHVISSLFKAAGYTYGPLLGLYFFGLFTSWQVKDRFVPMICISAPLITYLVQVFSVEWLFGYQFGFEVIILNGLITFLGLLSIRLTPKNNVYE
jgi:SSS family transporter